MAKKPVAPSQPTGVSTRKVSVGTVAAAITTVVIGGMQHWWGITVFPGLEGAIVILTGFIVSWIVPDHKEEE